MSTDRVFVRCRAIGRKGLEKGVYRGPTFLRHYHIQVLLPSFLSKRRKYVRFGNCSNVRIRYRSLRFLPWWVFPHRKLTKIKPI